MMSMLGSNLDILENNDSKKKDPKAEKDEVKLEKPTPPAAATPPADSESPAPVATPADLKPVLKGKKKAAAKKTSQ